MKNLLELEAHDGNGDVRVVVEVPRGSKAKFRYDLDTEAFTLQRVLPEGRYPYDWGFVPGTLASDGDPLDAMVIHEQGTWPGAIIPSVVIGALRINETKEAERRRNDRILVVPAADPRLQSVEQLSPDQKRELERFLVTTGELAGKSVESDGWAGPRQALDLIAAAIDARRRKRS